jgi:hypothetical protein
MQVVAARLEGRHVALQAAAGRDDRIAFMIAC